jgi:peptidoglycan/LPS O-acetylase OafA/YrhL
MKKAIVLILLLAPAGRVAVYLAFDANATDWLGRTIYGLPTSQIDAFAAGAAIVFWRADRAWRWGFLSLGVGLLAGASVLVHQHLAYHAAMKWTFGYAMFLMQDGGFAWGYSSINIIAALGIAAAVKSPPRLLQSAPIIRIGTISYGIYIYHLPLLLAFERFNLPLGPWLPAYFGLVYVLAELSYRFLETPFLRLKDKQPLFVGEKPESVVQVEQRAVMSPE